MPKFVIANGTSRLQFDLKKLRGIGETYGCNALYRDFAPDYIGCIDSPIFEEMVKKGAWLFSKMIAKHKYEGALKMFPKARDRIQSFKDALGEDRHFDTGQTMLDYAARNTKGPDKIFMLGFDLSNYIDSKKPTSNLLNNIYKGTNSYAPNDASEKFSGKWIKQMSTVFKENKIIQFYRVGGEVWPEEWRHIDNIRQMDYEEFNEYISNR